MSVSVRVADPADLGVVLALPDLSGVTRRLLAQDLAGVLPRHPVVAVEVGSVVGFAMATRAPDQVHLLDLTVAVAERRRGFAGRLVGALAGLAVADGATAMTLEVRVTNTAGRALYDHLGFADRGIRHGYYRDGEDARILWHDDLASLAEVAPPDSRQGVAPTAAPASVWGRH